jgi:hypothetical protein
MAIELVLYASLPAVWPMAMAPEPYVDAPEAVPIAIA